MHLLFDLDGTLTDPAPGIVACLEYALGEMGVPSEDPDLRRFIGPPLQETFAELLSTTDRVEIDQAIGHYRTRFSDVGLFENSVYAGIPDALSELAEMGHDLRVATAKPHVFADRIIDHFGLRDFFPRVYGSELSGERTDKKDLIEYVLKSEVLPTNATLMIGDRRHDIAGAKANGVAAIGVSWGFGGIAELTEAAPAAVVQSVGDLVATIGELASDRDSARGAPTAESPS